MKFIKDLWTKPLGRGDILLTEHDLPILNPWQRIPDVKEMKVAPSGWKILPIMFQIWLRSKPSILFTPLGNRRLNRYIEHQVIRLNRNIRKPAFWYIAEYILNRSRSFLIVSLHHCEPKWHREISLPFIYRTIRQYLRIQVNKSMVDYKRVYIPKGKDKRPIGVPSLEWRMYLHNLSNILTIYLQPEMGPNQHGFLPGRGTLTAWKHLLSLIPGSRDIYEFDLKGFFDNVKVKPVMEALYALNPPHIRMRERLDLIVNSNIKYKGPVLMEYESKFSPVRNQLPWIYDYYWVQLNKERQEGRRGFPQGAPMSPILSIYALRLSLEKVFQKIVLYADDGILFDEQFLSKIEDPLLIKFGIIINPHKSGWIRREDVNELPSFKFLGLRYWLETGEITSETRNPLTANVPIPDNWKDLLFSSVETPLRWFRTWKREYGLRPLEKQTLEKSEQIMRLEELLEDPQQESSVSFKPSVFTWEHFVRSKFSGLVLSHLYSGRFDSSEMSQNFSYTYRENTWSSVKGVGKPFINIFNSSSYACQSLSLMLRSQHRWRVKRQLPKGD